MVLIRVRVRRFFCADDSCAARTSVEQIDGLTESHARRSPPLRLMLEVLPGRDVAPLAARLAEHQGTEIVCRDRSSAYAEAVRTAVPEAVQVADRFHLWQNLATAVEHCVARHKSCLRHDLPPAQTDPTPPLPAAAAEPEPTGRLAERHREHHALGPGEPQKSMSPFDRLAACSRIATSATVSCGRSC